jgi:hypothetical protein
MCAILFCFKLWRLLIFCEGLLLIKIVLLCYNHNRFFLFFKLFLRFRANEFLAELPWVYSSYLKKRRIFFYANLRRESSLLFH